MPLALRANVSLPSGRAAQKERRFLSRKQVALRMIAQAPDGASLEDVTYELHFRQRVDRGLAELGQGETVSHQDVRRSIAK